MNNGEIWRWGYRAHGAVTLAMAANGRAVPDIRKAPWDSDRNRYKFLPLGNLDLQGRGEENPLWNQIVENSESNEKKPEVAMHARNITHRTALRTIIRSDCV